MRPIAISSPDGKVYAYACSVCHHVGISGRLLYAPEGGLPERIVESSRADAERCCTCYTCGARVKHGTRDVICETCEWWRRFALAWGHVGLCIDKHFMSIDEYSEWLNGDDDDVG